jgi:MFS family permease
MSSPLPRPTALMLNFAHALDHMFLLIFATSVAAIAADFGVARWEDLMPYSVGAFAMFGLCSLPAGRLGDLWGRRPMMLVFFFGMGVAALLVATTRSPWQIGIALTLLGIFSAIYHPVGIPMLVQRSARPGLTIGFNGLAGNLGVAMSAIVTGALVKYVGWKGAFVVPGVAAIAFGFLFARVAPVESEAPARRPQTRAMPGRRALAHIFGVVTAASISGSLLFNFTTNGNGELLRERLAGIVDDPATLGALLAAVYVVGALSQVTVGMLLDRVPIKALYGMMFAFMIFVFGAIPFTDALIVLYVDDRLRSRVSGMRLAVAFGVSSLAVWLLGPIVKASGFRSLLLLMAAIAFVTLCVVLLLPAEKTPGIGRDEPAPRAAD